MVQDAKTFNFCGFPSVNRNGRDAVNASGLYQKTKRHMLWVFVKPKAIVLDVGALGVGPTMLSTPCLAV